MNLQSRIATLEKNRPGRQVHELTVELEDYKSIGILDFSQGVTEKEWRRAQPAAIARFKNENPGLVEPYDEFEFAVFDPDPDV